MEQTTDTAESPGGSARGATDEAAARQWCRARRIDDIECIIPDQAGVARGKLMPTEKFFGGNPMTLPASMFTQTITGDYPEDETAFIEGLTDSDLVFRPDFSTLAEGIDQHHDERQNQQQREEQSCRGHEHRGDEARASGGCVSQALLCRRDGAEPPPPCGERVAREAGWVRGLLRRRRR